jgi:hypothetical protein
MGPAEKISPEALRRSAVKNSNIRVAITEANRIFYGKTHTAAVTFTYAELIQVLHVFADRAVQLSESIVVQKEPTERVR